MNARLVSVAIVFLWKTATMVAANGDVSTPHTSHLLGPLSDEHGYDESIARKFANLAKVAYCEDTNSVQRWSCGTCQETVGVVPGKVVLVDAANHNTRAVVGKLANENGCFLSIRGSHNLPNWVRNFQFSQMAPPQEDYEHCYGCRVHKGFYTIWKELHQGVREAFVKVGCEINGTTGSNSDIYVTGHSMGAAVAHLAMYTLKGHGYNIRKSYSFEAPRVGNKAFREAFRNHFNSQIPVFRVTHHKDPVVHLPPRSFGFEHISTEVFYYNSTSLNHRVCDDEFEEDPFCSFQYKMGYDVSEHCSVPFASDGDICNCQGAVDVEYTTTLI